MRDGREDFGEINGNDPSDKMDVEESREVNNAEDDVLKELIFLLMLRLLS